MLTIMTMAVMLSIVANPEHIGWSAPGVAGIAAAFGGVQIAVLRVDACMILREIVLENC